MYDIYSEYISAVATAANVDTSSVTITDISPGSVVVATSMNTPSSQAAAFRNKLASGHVFSAGTFGQVDVSSVQTDGASTDGDSSSAGVSSPCLDVHACVILIAKLGNQLQTAESKAKQVLTQPQASALLLQMLASLITRIANESHCSCS